jgi:hypothetical protein
MEKTDERQKTDKTDSADSEPELKISKKRISYLKKYDEKISEYMSKRRYDSDSNNPDSKNKKLVKIRIFHYIQLVFFSLDLKIIF